VCKGGLPIGGNLEIHWPACFADRLLEQSDVRRIVLDQENLHFLVESSF